MKLFFFFWFFFQSTKFFKIRNNPIGTCDLTKNSIPFGWQIVVSLIPWIVVFQALLGLQLSSNYAAPLGLAITIIIGAEFFNSSETYLHDNLTSMMGKVFLVIVDRFLWTAFDYASYLFAAIFFLEVLRGWGILERLRNEFLQITEDPHKLVLLVMFGFGMLLAVVSPGGTNYLITGSILIKLAPKPKITPQQKSRIVAEYNERHDEKICKEPQCLHRFAPTDEQKIQVDTNNRIGAIALFSNAISAAFNVLGICISATSTIVFPFDQDMSFPNDATAQRYANLQIGFWFSAMFFVLSVLSPWFIMFLFSKEYVICASNQFTSKKAFFFYKIIKQRMVWKENYRSGG